jgi:hypothetical protein
MNELVTNNSALPAHLQQGKKASFGNIDQNDLIIPRVKLLQSTSEEVLSHTERGAKIGVFWHTLAEEPLGDKLNFIPLILKKELVLWAPRGDDRGILARSSDLVNWDDGYANLEFEVKLKDVKEKITYHTRGNVAESGLAEFGSLNPHNPDSRPAASLTYRMMFYFPEFPEMSPAIVINTRSSIRAAKSLISKIELKPVDHYGQLYEMGTTDERGDEGPYKGYKYTSIGYVQEPEVFNAAKAMYEKFSALDWKTNDTEVEEGAASSGGAGAGPSTSDKF